MINKDRLFNRLMELGQIGNLSLIHIFLDSGICIFLDFQNFPGIININFTGLSKMKMSFGAVK